MSGWEDTSDMKAVLPEVSQSNEAQTANATESNGAQTADTTTVPREKPVANWGEKTANNYSEDNEGVKWDSNVAVYEWDGEEGDIGPEFPELENELFGNPATRDPQGIDFNELVLVRSFYTSVFANSYRIDRIDVTQEGIDRIKPVDSFKDAGLHPVMLRNIELAGYKSPTPIQRYCIPAIKMGYDLLAIAQTGK
jgi:ATP-dependent RNA helicase DDX3X